jgi:sulfite oxidase
MPGVTDKQLKSRSLVLPTIPLEKLKEDHGDDVWVTYKGGVYNVTPFLEAHPGGSARIEMVNGSDLSAYWKVYDLHNRPHIQQLLEEYRIGNLSAKDAERAVAQATGEFTSYYEADPKRPAAERGDVRVVSNHPWNMETKPHKLTDSFFTPNDIFFVRNHNCVPKIDAKEWSLEVSENKDVGLWHRNFTLDDLKTRFPKTEVVSVMQCAGNRQEDYIEPDRPLYVAPHWRGGAIGCARWAGVRVRDLLGTCGMDVDGMALGKVQNPKAKIVNFEAEDQDETGTPYAGVIPVEKAIDPFGDAILAYEMNGEELPRDHGYPLRLVAPGTGGCRNVKWIRNISVTEKPSELDSGSKLDRHFAPTISWTSHREHCTEDRTPGWKPPVTKGPGDGCEIKLEQGPVIQTLPVQSIICWPPNNAVLSGKDVSSVEVKGVAFSGGGRGICRVEVSLDDGANFHAANLVKDENPDRPSPEAGMGRHWSWAQFTHKLELPAEVQAELRKGKKVDVQVCAKAIDGDFNTQPERMHTSWNVLGICVNHWPRATFTLDPKLPKNYVPKIPQMPEPGSCEWPKASI